VAGAGGEVRRAVGPALAVGLLLAATVVGLLVALGGSDRARCPGPPAAVVLDPGHGGEDAGAVNDAAGLVERELTLTISRRAAALLRAAGYTVALTRDDAATGLGNSERGRIANACGALAFVSVHLNSFTEPEPNYVRTFWGTAGKDLAFAETMHAALAAELRPGTDLADGGVEPFESGALLRARMAAALIEPVFLSHPAEAARLADGARAEQIARAIAAGVDAWFGRSGVATESRPAADGGGPIRTSDALLGPPRGSPERVVSAAEAAGAERLAAVRAYAAEVYRLAPLVGLDPALVVAQSALETGYWRSPLWRDHLNPAGLGIVDEAAASATWADGAEAARAQIVHLYLYAAGEIPPGHPLAPYRRLDPRYDAALAAGRAGVAPTLADLSGRWAVDPAYAESVARVGNELFGDG
jgi:N-acetylmuramoyl-L-alanine amidase